MCTPLGGKKYPKWGYLTSGGWSGGGSGQAGGLAEPQKWTFGGVAHGVWHGRRGVHGAHGYGHGHHARTTGTHTETRTQHGTPYTAPPRYQTSQARYPDPARPAKQQGQPARPAKQPGQPVRPAKQPGQPVHQPGQLCHPLPDSRRSMAVKIPIQGPSKCQILQP